MNAILLCANFLAHCYRISERKWWFVQPFITVRKGLNNLFTRENRASGYNIQDVLMRFESRVGIPAKPERSFRKESEQRSGMIPNTIGA